MIVYFKHWVVQTINNRQIEYMKQKQTPYATCKESVICAPASLNPFLIRN